MTQPLPRFILGMLASLYEAGGSGECDVHAHVMTGSPRRQIPGAPQDWLRLVAAGLLAGEGGLLILTQAGREKAEELLAGRTKTATQV